MSKTALVTGASSGLGLELARLFGADHHDVVLVARRREKLDAIAVDLARRYGVRATVLSEDLTDPAAPGRIASELSRSQVEIEFLVNCAGFGTNGAFADLDARRELELVQVNIAALVHLTRLLLPPMLARGSGRILNIGSSAGFQPGPFMASYYASKAFVNSFTEALGFELRGTGVTATVTCPGATATEFSAVAGSGKSRLFQMGTLGAPAVAAHAYKAMMRGRAVAIPGFRDKLLLQSLRISPRSLVRSISAALNRTAPG
jgi:uncharacterized protein